MKISQYLTLAEATKSQTATRHGVDNTPNAAQLQAMKITGRMIFDKVREYIGGPLAATSFFRGPELNKLIGGSATSQHCKGEAVDMDADVFGMGTNKFIFLYIKEHLEFDQLIWEFGDNPDVNHDRDVLPQPAWVHASYSVHGNRGQILIAYRDEHGKTKYRGWI